MTLVGIYRGDNYGHPDDRRAADGGAHDRGLHPRDRHRGGVAISVPFRDPFDRILAAQGPPAIFTVDAEGELRLDPMRTRDGWSRLPPDAVPPHEVCHCLYRDRATGYVQYVLVTAPALFADHPRADVRRFPDQASASAALAALGRPPLLRSGW